MRFSNKSHLAVSMMVDVALREHFGPVTVAPLAKRHHVTPAHIENVISRLRRHGLVEGLRGAKGGYVLARTSKNITVADIVVAVDEQAAEDAARLIKHHKEGRDAQDFWDALTASVLEQLRGISLLALVQQEVAKGVKITVAQAPARGRRVRPFEPDVEAEAEPKAKPLFERQGELPPNSVFSYAQSVADKG